MGQQIDRTKTAEQNMLALINTGSTFQFTGTEFTYGLPSSQTPADPQENTNSQVTLTAVAGSGFTGTQTVRYRRLALGATRPGALTSYTITGSDDINTLKAAIALEHNLVPDQFSLTGTLPTTSGEQQTFTLTAIANSLLYTGSTTVTVTFQ